MLMKYSATLRSENYTTGLVPQTKTFLTEVAVVEAIRFLMEVGILGVKKITFSKIMITAGHTIDLKAMGQGDNPLSAMQNSPILKRNLKNTSFSSRENLLTNASNTHRGVKICCN